MSGIVVLTGPTCSGKTSVESALTEHGFNRLIGHTTRNPRPGEVNGEHYHFVSDAEFDELLATGKMLESVEFGDRRYGKSVSALSAAMGGGHNAVAVLEPQGARALRRHCERADIPFFGVWIDCAPGEQARRFLSRPDFDLQSQIQRLSEMLSIEQDWREWMFSGMDEYELRISATHVTPQLLASSIITALEKEEERYKR